jgi:hypothetical protein
MASITQLDAREQRLPDLDVLPDGRKRITRYLKVNSRMEIPPELNLAPGEPDFFPNAPAGWTGLLLTYFKATDEMPPGMKDSVPVEICTFEQISPTGETPEGAPDERVLPDGRRAYDRKSVMFSFNGFTPGNVGTDVDPDDTLAFLQAVESTDDGTLRHIKRTYVYAGILEESTQFKYNGALTIKTITEAVTVPTTPSGFVLIGEPIQSPNGYPIYTYTYAAGLGQISYDIEYRQSPDQGANGVTITTIKALTAPGGSNPITGPGSSELIRISYEEADGYRIWTGVYANGAGIIYTSVDTKYGGKLIIYKITSLNGAPSTPSATIGGTVTLISAIHHNGSRFESGVVIYEYTWAEGEGQISEAIEYIDSVDQGTNGVTRTTIRYLVANGGSIQPTSLSGSVLVRQEYEDVEGYRIWTTVWGKGAGITLNETTISEDGALVLYHIIELGTAPSTPSATIGGTVTLYESGTRTEEGYTAYDYRWSEGHGQSGITVRAEPDGALLYEQRVNTATLLTASAFASAYPFPGSGTGYLIDLEQDERNGYVINRATWKLPPATVTLRKQMRFNMPGQIELTSPDPGWVLVPQVDDTQILASEEISYATSQITATPYTVLTYASINYSYSPVTGNPTSGVIGANKYLSGSTSDTGGSATFNGIPVTAYAYEIAASDPSAPPSGVTTLEVNNEIYLTDVTGTIVYKRREVTYTF